MFPLDVEFFSHGGREGKEEKREMRMENGRITTRRETTVNNSAGRIFRAKRSKRNEINRRRVEITDRPIISFLIKRRCS